jgi:hypothetical protein
MLINPRVIFRLMRQRWSNTTFSLLLALLVLTSNRQIHIDIWQLLSFSLISTAHYLKASIKRTRVCHLIYTYYIYHKTKTVTNAKVSGSWCFVSHWSAMATACSGPALCLATIAYEVRNYSASAGQLFLLWKILRIIKFSHSGHETAEGRCRRYSAYFTSMNCGFHRGSLICQVQNNYNCVLNP